MVEESGWQSGSLIEPLPSKCEALSSIPPPKKRIKLQNHITYTYFLTTLSSSTVDKMKSTLSYLGNKPILEVTPFLKC
jgi:hypothetical protein